MAYCYIYIFDKYAYTPWVYNTCRFDKTKV